MATRLISAIVGIAVLFAIVLSGSMTALSIALCVCALIGMYELYKAFGFLKKPLLVLSGGAMTVFLMMSRGLSCGIILGMFFVYALILVCQLLADHKNFGFPEFATAAFCVIYVPLPLLALLNLRHEPNGFFLLWIALGGAWVTDSFAYFSGRLFGKHKLCPDISPKKTVEGSVGGTVCTVLIGLLYGFLISRYADVSVNYVTLSVLAVICAVVSQMGDLTASVIKREKGVKDFGNLMPGHGGFMDRFDSTLFVAPAVYLFNMIFPVFW